MRSVHTSRYGLLRPGECVPPTADGFDAAKHPTRANVQFYAQEELLHPSRGNSQKPTHMVFTVKHSKTDQERLTQDVVVGATSDMACGVAAMWRYMCGTSRKSQSAPLFMRGQAVVTYTQMLSAVKAHVKAAGPNVDPKMYGGHSFRIGGSQALAAAGRSITYIMSYGRWRCTESVLRYVKTPLYIRMLDAHHMADAATSTKWEAIDAQVRTYYERTHIQQQLWDASLMVSPPSA